MLFGRAVVAAIVLSATQLGPGFAIDGATNKAERTVAEFCHVVGLDLSAAEVPGSPAYRSAASFAQAPSPYYDFWNIKVASESGVSLASLGTTRKELAAGLTREVANGLSTADPGVAALNELQYLEFVVGHHASALRHLVETTTASLHDGNQYRLEAKAPPSWSATLVAAQVRSDVGLPNAQPPVAVLESALTATSAKSSSPSSDSEAISIMSLLWHNSSNRPMVKEVAARLLPRIYKLAVSSPPTPITSILLTAVEGLADTVDVSLPKVPVQWVKGLLASNHLMPGASDLSEANPQVTYYALALGAHLSSGVDREVLADGLVSSGWIWDFGSANPVATYEATTVAKGCGEQIDGDVLKSQVLAWLKVAARGKLSEAGEYYALARLAGLLHVSLGRSAVRAFAGEADKLLGEAPSGAPAQVDLSLGLGIAQTVDLSLGNVVRTKLEKDLRTLEASRPRFVYTAVDVQMLGRTLGENSTERADQAIGRFRAGDLYVAEIGPYKADIISTEEGLALIGARASDRTLAVERLMTGVGPVLQLLTQPADEVVDLNSIYYAYQLLAQPAVEGVLNG